MHSPATGFEVNLLTEGSRARTGRIEGSCGADYGAIDRDVANGDEHRPLIGAMNLVQHCDAIQGKDIGQIYL